MTRHYLSDDDVAYQRQINRTVRELTDPAPVIDRRRAHYTPPVFDRHAFDLMVINKGTEESPDYYVKVYDSSNPDSPYAGAIIVYEWVLWVPVTELEVTTDDRFFVRVLVTYDSSPRPDPTVSPFFFELELLPVGDHPVGYTTFQEVIANGTVSSLSVRSTGNITVYGRWV